MILAADIGNTNIVLGGFESGVLCFTLRLPSNCRQSTEDYVRKFRRLLRDQGVTPEDAQGCVLSSVVPELQMTILATLRELTSQEPLLVDAKLDSGLIIRDYDETKLGSDRIADAVSALALYAPPIAVFDMGTATTLSVLDQDGCLIGGMIMPGLRLSVNALSAQAAQLPPIELAAPHQLLGTDTVSCMQCGAIYGAAALLDGVTERVEAQLGQTVNVVVTGGLSGCVVPYCRHEVHHEPNLLLQGLALLFERNCCPAVMGLEKA